MVKIRAGTGCDFSGSGRARARALGFGLESGSGLGIFYFWAQIIEAYSIKSHSCATFGYRALSGFIKSRARAFSSFGLM